jgi:hypothetical protein
VQFNTLPAPRGMVPEIQVLLLLSQAKTIAVLDTRIFSLIFVNKGFNYEAGILKVNSVFRHDVDDICDFLEYKGPHAP